MTETIKIDEEEWPSLHQFGPEVSAGGAGRNLALVY